MTPASYAAHTRAWYRKQRREQSRTAVLAMILANANRGKNAAPFKVDDFMGSFAEEEMEGGQ